MPVIADHQRTTVSPGRRGTPFTAGDYWLDKRPDGRSPLWAVAWYDPVARTVRYRSTRTADLGSAKDFLASFALDHAGPRGTAVEKRTSCHVYFIGGEVGAIKIGLTESLERRLATIQSNSPIALRVLSAVAGGRDVELGYHKRFAAHRAHGEWFERVPEILAEIDRLNPPSLARGERGVG